MVKLILIRPAGGLFGSSTVRLERAAIVTIQTLLWPGIACFIFPTSLV